jgi:hypothetical protein
MAHDRAAALGDTVRDGIYIWSGGWGSARLVFTAVMPDWFLAAELS